MSYAVGLLSRFASHPTVATCKLLVYALQYLRGTVHMGIRYSGSMFDLHVFTDAAWAGDTIGQHGLYCVRSRWTHCLAIQTPNNGVDVVDAE